MQSENGTMIKAEPKISNSCAEKYYQKNTVINCNYCFF